MCTLEGCGSHADMPPLVVAEADRRAFLKGLDGLPLAAVLADPALAQVAAAGTEPVAISVPGGSTLPAAIAYPKADKAPTLILIHEWWGLNDQIKAVAAEFAAQGYLVIAVDLYGKVAKDANEAKALMSGLDAGLATRQMTAAVAFARAHARSNGKVATCGWCFGGGWSLNTSLATPVDATVIYYGNVAKTAAQLKTLKGPVLGHFGTRDQSINAAMVGGFEQAMKEAGLADRLTVYWYDADHAFANPTGARYDAEDAALAWERTLVFLKKTLA
ncbi:MAG: dienelactone hydrolase family protein [Phyllobacteriaceae bacterium]|nr:dienelactone hydrolase family protein [Phyllobacteriaceae bacterium]